MARVYQNSYITIAATKSSNSQSSLLRGLTKTHQLDGHHYIQDYPRIEHCGRELLPVWDTVSKAYLYPLLDRAWVYQERLLSPRVLHFGPNELFWECCQIMECECGSLDWMPPGDLDTLSDFDLNSQSTIPPKVLHQHALQSKDPVLMTRRWQKIVHEYSRLSLTNETDRLIALEGLATQMKVPQSNQYAFGLWKDTLAADLLWSVGAHLSSIATESQWIEWKSKSIPSWSWGSVARQVMFADLPKKEDLRYCLIAEQSSDSRKPGTSPPQLVSKNTIESSTTGSLSLNTFAESGRLDLRAITVPITLVYFSNGHLSISLWHENRPKYMERGVHQSNIAYDTIAEPWSLRLDCDMKDVLLWAREPLYCCLVAQTKKGSHFLLLRSRDPSKKIFSRIGVAFFGTRGYSEMDAAIQKEEESLITII